MKRFILMLTVVVFGSLLVSAQSSLADAARQAKTEKQTATPAKHVYTNDDIMPAATPAVEKAPGEAAAPAAGDASKADSAKTDAAKPEAAKGDEKSAEKGDKKETKEDTAAKATALKDQIAAQKKAISDQEKEISISEREHQIRVATYYADAGNQLRTGEKWFQDEKKYQEDLDGKKKALTDAKAKLDQTMEEARKAGVPANQLN
jgi:hypothetical protein